MANERHLNKLCLQSLIKTHESFMLINQSGWKNDEEEFITAIKCKCETISSRLNIFILLKAHFSKAQKRLRNLMRNFGGNEKKRQKV